LIDWKNKIHGGEQAAFFFESGRRKIALPGEQVKCLPMEDTMAVQWIKDLDAALAEAKDSGKPVLLDFSAAPA